MGEKKHGKREDGSAPIAEMSCCAGRGSVQLAERGILLPKSHLPPKVKYLNPTADDVKVAVLVLGARGRFAKWKPQTNYVLRRV